MNMVNTKSEYNDFLLLSRTHNTCTNQGNYKRTKKLHNVQENKECYLRMHILQDGPSLLQKLLVCDNIKTKHMIF